MTGLIATCIILAAIAALGWLKAFAEEDRARLAEQREAQQRERADLAVGLLGKAREDEKDAMASATLWADLFVQTSHELAAARDEALPDLRRMGGAW